MPMQKDRLTAVLFCLSINPLYGVRGSFTQGELEGAKPASNKIKCRAKPCLARRAWSEATIFVPQGGTKITTLFQAVERAKGFFDSLKRTAIRRSFFCSDTVYTPSFSNAASFSALQKMAMACSSSLTGGKDGAMRILLSQGSMP